MKIREENQPCEAKTSTHVRIRYRLKPGGEELVRVVRELRHDGDRVQVNGCVIRWSDRCRGGRFTIRDLALRAQVYDTETFDEAVRHALGAC